MDPHACPLPVGQSPPPSEQALPATLKQLLGIGEQELVPDASRRSNTLIFTVIGTLTLLVASSSWPVTYHHSIRKSAWLPSSRGKAIS